MSDSVVSNGKGISEPKKAYGVISGLFSLMYSARNKTGGIPTPPPMKTGVFLDKS